METEGQALKTCSSSVKAVNTYKDFPDYIINISSTFKAKNGKWN